MDSGKTLKLLQAIPARVPITNEERELVFELCEGVPSIIHLIGAIRVVAADTRDVDYMGILRWMKRQNLKGSNLWSWFHEKQDGSILQAIAFARKNMHSDFGIKKIFAKPS